MRRGSLSPKVDPSLYASLSPKVDTSLYASLPCY